MEGIRLILRPALAADADAMKEILHETFEGTWLPVITPAAAEAYRTGDRGGRYVDQHCRDFWVAEIDGVLAGLVHWEGDFIHAVHVRPRYSGRGVGHALLEQAEAAIAKAGFEQARLETDTFNTRSHALYRSRAYAEHARYPDDEWASGFTTILFVKSLAAAFDRP